VNFGALQSGISPVTWSDRVGTSYSLANAWHPGKGSRAHICATSVQSVTFQ